MRPETSNKGSYLGLNDVELNMTFGQGEKELRLEAVPICYVESNLRWAEHVQLGILGFVKKSAGESKKLNTYLSRYIEKKEPDQKKFGGSKNSELIHWLRRIDRIGPFEVMCVGDEKDAGKLRIFYPKYVEAQDFEVTQEQFTYRWKAAIYILAKETPPSWYQLSLLVDENLVNFIRYDAKGDIAIVTRETKFLQVTQVDRPVVELEVI